MRELTEVETVAIGGGAIKGIYFDAIASYNSGLFNSNQYRSLQADVRAQIAETVRNMQMQALHDS